MRTIATVTFAPCIDKSFSVEALQPEKKLSCSTPILEPGGGGINVARALSRLGTNAVAVFPAGGYTGMFLKHLVTEAGVRSIVPEVANETRENIIVFDKETNNQYRFGMPPSPLSTLEWKQCLQAITEISDFSYLVVSGSIPMGAPVEIYSELATIARSKNARLVLDCPGNELRKAAGTGVYLMKPSIRELAALCNENIVIPTAVPTLGKRLIAAGICDVLVVSIGPAGALLITKNTSRLFTPPAVEKKSTVGAGDSLVAGILDALVKNKSLSEAVSFGVACGTSATQHPGTQLCDKTGAEQLLPLIKMKEV